nr:MauE/DoxX family redox-associated membrane protein [Micromonospora sp. DSM 115978]
MAEVIGRGDRLALVRPWLGTAVRLGLAVVWLYAGGSKVGDLAASGRAVNAYQVLPYDLAVVVGYTLPFVEIALGVLLVLGLASRLAAGISAALLVVFIAGIISAWARGLTIDCGCFGNGGELPAGQTPSYGPELLRDLGFLALAGFLLAWPRTALSVDGWLAGADRDAADERLEEHDG